MLIGAGVVGVLSRFPIVKKQLISHSECNGLAAFYLEMPKNDTLIVVNVHLESQRLRPTTAASTATFRATPRRWTI